MSTTVRDSPLEHRVLDVVVDMLKASFVTDTNTQPFTRHPKSGDQRLISDLELISVCNQAVDRVIDVPEQRCCNDRCQPQDKVRVSDLRMSPSNTPP